jgi:vitamin B12 transporter
MTSTRIQATLTVLLLLATFDAPAASAAEAAGTQAEVYEFHIPAQGLCEALQAFARVSRQQVTFDSAALSGAKSKEVSGRFTAAEALRRLLEGTPVTFRRGSQGIWMITPRQNVPAAQEESAASTKAPTRIASTTPSPHPKSAEPADKPASRATPGEPAEFQELVISASRVPQEARRTSSSVTAISLPEMARAQIEDLKTSLAQQAGVNVITTGTVGGGTSVYIRGAYPHHTLFIVDGVRMNDRSASYDAFLGGSSLGGFDRIEVLRGPQSPLYGSAAMGGVILLDTSHGTKDAAGTVAGSVGSFDTASGSIATTGSAGPVGYSVALDRFATANDEPQNGFHSWNYSARLDYALAPGWELGITYRGQDAQYESTGSRSLYVHGTVDSSTDLSTLRVEWHSSDAVSSRVILGYHRREYRWISDEGRSDQLNERRVAEWQTTWAPSHHWSFVVGANYESSDYDISSSQSRERIAAGFLSGTWMPTEALTLTAGARQDHFDTVGSAFTWRAGVAWLARPSTKLRATQGAGFAAPGSSDRFGVPAWGQLPNPDLRPERSRGWDVGVDQSLLDGALTLNATWFENRFNDLIDWSYVDVQRLQGMYVNRRRASTKGAELAVAATPLPLWHVRLGYTRLEGKDDDTGQRLARRPRNTVDVSTWVDFTSRWTVGLGLHGIDDRVESAGTVGGYTVARVFSSVGFSNGISLKVRAENVLDRRYDEVYGYAALPRGIYGSVEWKY